MGKAQGQKGAILRKDFPGDQGGSTCRHHPNLGTLDVHFIEGTAFGVSSKSFHLVFQGRPVPVGVGGRGDEFFSLPLVGDGLDLDRLTGLDQASGVADPGGHAKEDGQIEVFRKLVGFLDHIQGILAVSRLKEGELGRPCVVAVVLFILRGVHARIITRDNDKTPAHPVIGGGKEGICGHIEAYMLHGGH